MVTIIIINMKKIGVISLILCSVLIANTFAQADKFEYKLHHNPAITEKDLPYRLFIPDNYDVNKKYPLILFLHGAGERGDDNDIHINSSSGALLWARDSIQLNHPGFVLAPQCPISDQWVNTNWLYGSYSTTKIPITKTLRMVVDIIDSLKENYSLDTTSFFVTGFSMGGYGTWDIIIRYPEMFRAAIPICGAGDPTKAKLLVRTPIWCFHSADDPIVPVKGTREMVAAINGQGTNNRDHFYTEYTNYGHFAWGPAYDEPELVSWLFNTKPVEYTPDVTSPEPPDNLSASEITQNKIRVNWQSQSPDVYYFKIYKNGLLIDSTFTTNFKRIINLSAGTTYNFMVSAVDWVGNESVNNFTLQVSTLNATFVPGNSDLNDKLIISPNPSDGIIQLSGISINDETVLKVYSSKGQLVLQKSINGMDENIILNLNGYSPGLYHLIMINTYGIINRGKFVLL
jgi:poly(3-hydroxybutyrate) depolymerase